MLFQDQRDSHKIVEGEIILFTGTFLVNVPQRIVGFVIGIKQKDSQIRTTVSYHQKNEKPQVKVHKVLSPAGFEKFLNETAMMIASKLKQKLVEFSFRTRVIDDPFTAFLEDEEKEYLHQVFLLNVIAENSKSDAYSNVSEVIKNIVKQRI